MRNRKRSFSTGLAFRTTGEKSENGKAEHREESGYLRSGLVSVSGVLVLVVLTLDYRINVISVNRKKVNPGKSDAWFQASVHHDSEKGDSKRRNASVHEELRGNRFSQSERKSGCMYVCGVSGLQNTRRRTGKMELLYMRSVFGRWVPNQRRPGDPVAGTSGSGDQGEEPGKREGDVQVVPGRCGNGMCV